MNHGVLWTMSLYIVSFIHSFIHSFIQSIHSIFIILFFAPFTNNTNTFPNLFHDEILFYDPYTTCMHVSWQYTMLFSTPYTVWNLKTLYLVPWSPLRSNFSRRRLKMTPTTRWTRNGNEIWLLSTSETRTVVLFVLIKRFIGLYLGTGLENQFYVKLD